MCTNYGGAGNRVAACSPACHVIKGWPPTRAKHWDRSDHEGVQRSASAQKMLGNLKNFNYPKFFNRRKYEMTIEGLGSTMFTSASSGEASHKSTKNAHRHTIRQGDRAVDQVSTVVSPLVQHPECSDRACPCQL